MIDESLKTYSLCTECNQVNRVSLISPQGKIPACGKCHADLPFHDGITSLQSPGIALLSQKVPLPVVVDFWASWCRPCHIFAPTFKQAAQALAGRVVFAKVNVENNPLASDHYRIQGIPVLIVFNQGIELARQAGALPLESCMSWITGVARSQKAA